MEKLVWNSICSSRPHFYYTTMSFKGIDGACHSPSSPCELLYILAYLAIMLKPCDSSIQRTVSGNDISPIWADAVKRMCLLRSYFLLLWKTSEAMCFNTS